jgi:hypothetical protein
VDCVVDVFVVVMVLLCGLRMVLLLCVILLLLLLLLLSLFCFPLLVASSPSMHQRISKVAPQAVAMSFNQGPRSVPEKVFLHWAFSLLCPKIDAELLINALTSQHQAQAPS